LMGMVTVMLYFFLMHRFLSLPTAIVSYILSDILDCTFLAIAFSSE